VRFGEVRSSNVAALRRITPFPSDASLSKFSCAPKAREIGASKRAQMPAKISIFVVGEQRAGRVKVDKVT
jgi:hypothetical protein